MGGDEEVGERWLADEELLAAIGRALQSQSRTISVRLPIAFAEQARLAWGRDDGVDAPSVETQRAKALRRRAADLALIGLAIEEGGLVDGAEVVVNLDVFFIASALEAAAELEVRRYVEGDGG